MDQDARIFALLVRIKRINAKLRKLDDPRAPLLWRLWHRPKFRSLLDRACELLDEIEALQGKPARPAQVWLGMGRKGWMRLQALLGILNAYLMVSHFGNGDYLRAAFSGAFILVTATWALPYAPPKR